MVRHWIEAGLVHSEGDALGQPIRFEPFQRYLIDRKYEYDPATGRLLYDRCLFGLAKGNSKTELMADDSIARLAGPLAPLSPNIPVAAASWEQANRLFGAARLAIEEGPLREAFKGHIFEDRVTNPDRAGVLSRIAAIAGTNDGGLPTDVYEDEVHEWAGDRRERVDVVLGNGLKKRTPRAELPDGRVCIGGQQVRISTAGDDPNGLLARLYGHGRKVASGEIADPRFLFLWWEAGGEHDLETEEGLVAAIREANPAVGAFMSLENLMDRFADPVLARYEYERYHLNRWVLPPSGWISMDVFAARRHSGGMVLPPAGTKVCLGFDGSYNFDSTAIYGATMAGHVFKVASWDRDPRDPDWKVSHIEVNAAIDAAFARYDVQVLHYDPALFIEEREKWAIRYGEQRVLALTGSQRLADATGRFYMAVMDGSMTHDGDPLLIRHVGNARTRETQWGLVIRKDAKDSPNHIDHAQAAVNAFYGVSAPAAAPVDRTLYTWS